MVGRSVSQSICMSGNGNKVTINGKTVEVPGRNISVINGKIFVNGKEFNTEDTDLKDSKGSIINIIVEGNVEKIQCNGNVEVRGDATGDINCGGSASIIGNIVGNIDCGGSASIKGDHKGSIDAGGSLSIR